ncbi:hypothetical protein CsSME_00026536 [Camellia sinensis var. sinensis]
MMKMKRKLTVTKVILEDQRILGSTNFGEPEDGVFEDDEDVEDELFLPNDELFLTRDVCGFDDDDGFVRDISNQTSLHHRCNIDIDMGSRRSLCLLVVVVLMGWSEAYQFNVGGKEGWVLNPSENYNHWAGRMRFQVNDTLLFKYNNGSDSVLVVNKQDYDNCNTQNPITKMEDGNSVFKLDRSGPFYIISGNKSNCDHGQKLIVVVLAIRNKPTTSPPPSPSAGAPSPLVQTPSPSPSTPSPSPTVSPSPATSSPSPSPVPSPTTTPSASPTPAPTTAPASSPPTTPSPATMSPPSPTPGGSPANVAPPHSSAPALSSSLLFVSSVTFALLSLYIF